MNENLIGGANVEEIISALWAICAILCFGFGFDWWAYAFSVKAALDTAISIRKAVKEQLKEDGYHV